ncbi:PDR/VanB family oxidoreductase [Saccharopolyspora sp. K220]|uniref:PDR/VanB family oxidoreductase n=1 Tax=Saccharopolyspora soli TaxID=2926618 RepID=UPI001F56CF29|nr:PDR/VanB family oxidoreductase [Saccharopolyspora soli]MCI2420916.1 PDR/VanB family oxidoreductase [Saccharopolyspora soli]
MTTARHDLTLRVTAATWEADGVLGLTLHTIDGSDLPVWEAGAHIDVLLPSGRNRQYSLCGDPRDRKRYQIAVRLEDAGRGGSAEIHGTALVGEQLRVASPRNHFALREAAEYLLIAGGIGVTPLLPMATALHRRTAAWSMLYCGRGADTMPFREELVALGGKQVRLVDTTIEDRPDLKDATHRLPPDAVVYCCGPASLIDAVVETCEASGTRYETERFAANEQRTGTGEDNDELELELRRSGVVLAVGPDTTLLEAIRGAGVEADSDCEEGYCGTCETTVLEGDPDHRDVVLSKVERAAGKTMMPCVSRACGKKLVLDL